MKYTLKDIAKESGLSIATVSRFLCGKRRHYNLKEKQIFKLANKYHYPYIQNFYNNGIKLKVSLATNIKKGEYFSSLLSDFHIAAKDSHCELEIIDIEKNDFLKNKLSNLSKTRDGICILFPKLSREDCQIIESYLNYIPILSLSPLLDGSINTMTFDNYRGGYIAARHLHQLGYTELGIISGDESVFEAYQRKNGFMDYIRSNNLNYSWEFKGDYSLESGKKAFLKFKNDNLKNIGLFGVNDYMCFGFMKLALISGIKIPEELSIIGFDDTPFCNNTTPELSSISTNFIELGKRALASIEKSFTNYKKNINSTNLVPVDIISRESTKTLQI